MILRLSVLLKARSDALGRILNAYPDVDSAITGIRQRWDYVVKPSTSDTLFTLVVK
jgi:hypothetical protein